MPTIAMPILPTSPNGAKLLFLQAPAGLQGLALRSFHGNESLSELFQFNLALEALTPLSALDAVAKMVLGQPVTFGLRLPDGKLRSFRGIVCRFAETVGAEARYEMEVVPRLWLLRLRADCRTFVDQSIPTIVDTLLKEAGIAYKARLNLAGYSKREMCVQYRETAFHFLSRLLEQEGIHYYFEEGDGIDGLVLSDAAAGPRQPLLVPYRRHAGADDYQHDEAIDSWRHQRELRPASYTLTSYNFKDLGANLEASVPSLVTLPGLAGVEVRDWSPEYETAKAGERYARLRMEEEETPHAVSTGSGTVGAFAAGGMFRFSHAGHQGNYTLVSVTHTAQEDGDGFAPSYRNSFVCLPATVRFRPPRVTAKPTIAGAQTAVVAGPGGRTQADSKDFHVDEYGRIKVRFCWDRPAQGQDSSCWVRVSQLWAGRGWGSFRVPRIGEEVILHFLDGDPDRPIVAGSVYNTKTSLPCKPMEHATRFILFRSHSSPKGGRHHASEISVEDKKGSEQLRLRAQRNLHLWVENESRERIGAGGKHVIINGELRELLEKGHDCHIKKGARTRVEGSHSLQVDQDLQFKAGRACTLQSGANMRLEAGGDFIVKAARIILVGPDGNFLVIGPAGIVLQSQLAKINCGDAPPALGPVNDPAAPEAPHIAEDGQQP